MTERLRHSEPGYLRALQMCSQELFVFVEGKTDRHFYAALCEGICAANTFHVRSVEELPGATGGKHRLLDFHQYLTDQAALISVLAGKTTRALFFADKDVDDLRACAKVCEHLVYTEHYQFENYLFREVDLASVAALASSLDRQSCRNAIGPNDEEWRRACAESWREWLVVCLAAALSGARCAANYSVHSRVHKPSGELDVILFGQQLKLIQDALGWEQIAIETLEKSARSHVHQRLSAGQHDSIFPGRWYVPFLVKTIEAAAGERAFVRGSIEARLMVAAEGALRFDAVWAAPLRARIATILAKPSAEHAA